MTPREKPRLTRSSRKPASRTKRGTFEPIPIDWLQINALLAIRCTLREVASVAGVNEETIQRAIKAEHGQTFREYAERKQGPALANLRRRQYELAMAGDRTMLIWLGKQWLGQAEKQEHTGADGGPIQHFVTLTPDERAARLADLLERARGRRTGARTGHRA